MQFPRRPSVVIFDKDGTLIDFVAMWGNWAEAFIARVCSTVSAELRLPLYEAIGMDPITKKIQSDGALAIAPEATTQRAIATLVQQHGVAPNDALALVQRLWQAPDPTATAVPCADLPALFAWIRADGCLIAVATADNRAPTQATLQSLGIAHAIAAIACADDPGVAPKPAPDKILVICNALAVHPREAIMVGDTPSDMLMGKNAGVMACVGVTTGVCQQPELAVYADVVLDNVGQLKLLWR
jgi:phosphoglycolate phosphatase-like HAD superfamily hydrolase